MRLKLFFSLLLLSPILGGIPNAFAQTQDADIHIVPGTAWRASVTRDGSEFVSCQIAKKTNSAEVRFTIGSKGGFVFIVHDIYQERMISEVLGWDEGLSFRAQLFADNMGLLNVEAHRIWEHSLLVPLGAIDRRKLLQTKNIALQVGGIAMRGYDIAGIKAALPDLFTCYEAHSAKHN
ncbi:hypothetical protein [Prosthecodimorpha hirschii]|uniref:hypothetical protein n=1 Tax=Prosthecodimorpha hirschii TaxID=665126 RepID=UPI00112D8965|nr:hypothetical protein [Prosthecomicrobium hirschii]